MRRKQEARDTAFVVARSFEVRWHPSTRAECYESLLLGTRTNEQQADGQPTPAKQSARADQQIETPE
jgi:hypothetical protein